MCLLYMLPQRSYHPYPDPFPLWTQPVNCSPNQLSAGFVLLAPVRLPASGVR